MAAGAAVAARGFGKMSDEDLRSRYDKLSNSPLASRGMNKRTLAAYEKEISRRQSLGDFGKAAPAAAVGSAAPAVSSGGPDMSSSLGAIEERISDLEEKVGKSSAPTSSAPSGVPGGSEVAASNVTADNDSVSVEAPTTFAPSAVGAAGDIFGKVFMRDAAMGAAKMIKNKKI